MNASKLSIVIPLHNEFESLPELHRELSNALNGFESQEIIFIDDGSVDKTLDALKKVSIQDRQIKILSFSKNYGQTIAIRAGIEAAQGDIIITMDGDLQNDPRDIPNLVTKLNEGYDIVQGWRKNRQDNFLKTWPSKVANLLASWLMGAPVHDIGCTLRAMRAEEAKHLDMLSDMHRFIPILALQSGARFAEIPVNHRARQYGESKYGLGRVFSVVLDLITIKFLSKYLQKPMRLFGTSGLILFLLGCLLALTALYMKYTQSFDLTGNPLSLASMVCLMTSVQFLFMGLLGEIASRIYFSTAHERSMYRIRERINF